MSTKKISVLLIAIATLLVIGSIIYKISSGKEVGFQEVLVIAALVMMLFSSLTWGSKEEKDDIFEKDELGKKITERSSKISYFVLLACILGAVVADELVNGTINIFLLIVLGLGMVLLPITEFFVSKNYQ